MATSKPPLKGVFMWKESDLDGGLDRKEGWGAAPRPAAVEQVRAPEGLRCAAAAEVLHAPQGNR